jgi:transposase-like protein
MTQVTYCLEATREKKIVKLLICANNSNHAMAQAEDICRAIDVTSFKLNYGTCKQNNLSVFFNKLAANSFSYAICEPWALTFSNNVPCIYVFGKRYYVRDLIVRYLDIPKEGVVARPSCNCKSCVNPYHFSYKPGKNSKLTGADTNMLLAFLGQGSGVTQAAKALKVHRSTIYRKLNRECLSTRSDNHRSSSRK